MLRTRKKLGLIAGVLTLLIISSGISSVWSLEISSFAIKRNYGYSSGKGQIQGDFTITAVASSDTTSLCLFFNGSEVARSNETSLSFQFQTDEYPNGWVNITIQATNALNATVEESEFREFVPASVNDPYWILLGAVSGLFIIGAVIATMVKRRRQETPPPDKSDIKIKIHKF